MTGLKELFRRHAVTITLLTLLVGLAPAAGAEDQFSAQLDGVGEVVGGQGTGFEHGTWYYYGLTDWWSQWFFNGFEPDGKKVVEVDLTIRVLDPWAGTGSYVEVALNWSTPDWPVDMDGPPLPQNIKDIDQERRYIERRVIVPQTDVRQSLPINTSFEIEDYCPQWVSIDVRGENVSIEGRIRHECVPQEGPPPPAEDRDLGDAPEGALAYPSSGIYGLFPTCVGVGPAAWIEHDSRSLYFGPKVDVEADGNAGKCPVFSPNTYNQDEGQQDGDAGLIRPRAYTIRTSGGSQNVYPLIFTGLESIANACTVAIWGAEIDIEVHNNKADGREAYVNVLFDWNQDGKWQGKVPCADGDVPEHVLVNFPVPQGYNGPLSGLNPTNFVMGPFSGYVWARFSIMDRPVPDGWNGDGVFTDGETEDYLLRVKEPLFFCDWQDGDPHKMHWAQLPDTRSTGLDVDLSSTSLADDFQCTQDGPITDIHFWGSLLDDTLPDLGPANLTFQISIYSNKPADGLIPWSRPGELLWSKKVAPFGCDVSEVTNNIKEGWFDPATKSYEPDNHKRTWQYNVCLDEEDDPLIQRQGTIYWLEITAIHPSGAPYKFGWKTTQQRLQFNDSAVWRHPTLGWLPMAYPDLHEYEMQPLDLAFVITGEPPEELDFGDAPDPTYATRHASNGARHTIVQGVYLGKRVDGEGDGQPNATATGDDIHNLDDEDGVVFVSALAPGDKATIEVTASVQGVLNTWIDWNADGDWDDLGEHALIDLTLGAGLNTVTFNVPAKAVPGATYARFRFSRMRGLRYTGPAPDGEVEDYQVLITAEAPIPGKPPVAHLKWSQPPIEHDPGSGAPVYCGWDEPAYAGKPTWYASASWRLVADDFRCVGDMPVTSVHWWGSYEAWDGSELPRTKPESWRIAFWSNVPADNRYPFSRPGTLLWLVNASPDRIEVERVGTDEFPGKPSDTTFQYLLNLQPHEFFWQSRYADTDTQDRVFWISITAVYTGSPEPDYPWGWKTRPKPWMDGAVKAELTRDDLRAGIAMDPATVRPIANSLVCERLDMYDMAFELDTDPDYIKWEQPFTGIRRWPHYEDEESLATEGPGAVRKWAQNPDTSSTGIDVDITRDLPPTWPETVCGDDFECTTTGPITGVTLWASWYHDILSGGSAENATFTLSIRQDIPADRSPKGHSMPGKVLWSKEFARGEFTVEPIQGQAQGYYSPANATFERSNHLTAYKYTFKIDSSEAFRQAGSPSNPVVYWLTAQARLVHAPGSVATRLGWKTSVDHWNDDAVWTRAEEPYAGSTWGELRYPKEHPFAPQSIDLAFEIETEKAGAGLTYRRVVADDWQCNSATPVTGMVWWGSYIGYGYQPCECQQMPAPQPPDYFLLSIWTDVRDPDPADAKMYSRPGTKIWEYEAEEFDEVLVGFDKHPEAGDAEIWGVEPVYRYSVRLPERDWFVQRNQSDVYWFSVVAVYKDAKAIVYPWGWTNHQHTAWDLQGLDALAHWKFDETGGLIAADSSGNGNDGTLVNNPIWRPSSGALGGALEFDGRNDYVTVENPKGFDFAPGSFSVSAWVNAQVARGQWRAIMEYDRFGVNGNRFGLWIDPDGRFHLRVGQNTWHSAQSLMPGQWYNLVATYDGDDARMKLYVNGVLDGEASHVKGFIAPRVAMLTIGARGSEDGEFFDGLLDDIRVFGSTLSDEDVLTLVGAGRNDDAVAAYFGIPSTTSAWPWTELFDQTGESEDMSFMLFTQPLGSQDDKNQGDGEIIIPGGWPTGGAKK